MNHLSFLACCLFTGALAAAQSAGPAKVAPPVDDKPHIDVVFCIDCSGSMGPVIETAKLKVWAIVNEIAKAKPSPVLRIGMLGYGNADRTFRQFDLSDDLDEVFKNLQTFRDEGWGSEFVGLAVHKATQEMKWSAGKQVLKVIYVIGNETARQGPPQFDYAKTAPEAIKRDIIVNAIYCGDVQYATATPTWREMARLADGQYMEIAQTGGAIVVATPFDKDLTELSGKLNTTYVAYGVRAAEGAAMQAAGDAASGKLGGGSGAADRALAKSSAQYRNVAWDLVDASREKDFDWSKVPDDQLPEELRKMTPEQRKAHVEAKAKERAEIQQKIKDLSAQRAKHIAEETKAKGLSGDKALDEAVKRSLNEQAKKKGFEFEKQ